MFQVIYFSLKRIVSLCNINCKRLTFIILNLHWQICLKKCIFETKKLNICKIYIDFLHSVYCGVFHRIYFSIKWFVSLSTWIERLTFIIFKYTLETLSEKKCIFNQKKLTIYKIYINFLQNGYRWVLQRIYFSLKWFVSLSIWIERLTLIIFKYTLETLS